MDQLRRLLEAEGGRGRDPQRRLRLRAAHLHARRRAEPGRPVPLPDLPEDQRQRVQRLRDLSRRRVDGRRVVESWAAGDGSERCFCPRCGSHVLHRDAATRSRSGTDAFDEPNLFEPTYEAWIVRREHWLKTTGLRRLPAQPHEDRRGRPTRAIRPRRRRAAVRRTSFASRMTAPPDLFRLHAQGAVEADRLAVQHVVVDDGAHELGVFLRPAEARRERARRPRAPCGCPPARSRTSACGTGPA